MLTPSVFGKDFFDDLFEFPFYDDRDMQKLEKKLYGRRGKNLMKTDIKDTDKAYELEMDLPGFKKDEIKVSLENGYLTISAARGLDVDEQEKETAKYIRKERYAGSCQRSFYVGEGVKQEDIKGEFKHGILKLVIPKKEEKPEFDYELLQELNRENAFGKCLQTFDQKQTEQAQMAKKKYADGMLASLQELTGKQALSIYTPTQVAEAWAEQQSQLKAGLQSLQQEIAANEQEQAELEEKLLACPDQTGTTNVLHEDIGKLQFDLSKLEFEDQQVDKKYSRRRLGFVLWIDTPLAIVLSLLVTVGMIDVFFMQAWEAWFRLVTSLIGFEIAFTIIGFCVYNMTKMLRKKLFGTEIPVETHARLQSQIRLLESKIHDLQLEESSRFLDQKNYDENSRRMKEVQKQYQQLLEKSEVILSVLDVNADKMVKE